MRQRITSATESMVESAPRLDRQTPAGVYSRPADMGSKQQSELSTLHEHSTKWAPEFQGEGRDESDKGQTSHAALDAEVALRKMHYYRDLLELGYRHAVHPDDDPDTLRTRRLALGINLPELDLVPLWSRRAPDGCSVSIPFIDFLLAQFVDSLERYRRDLREARRARAMLWGNPTSSGTSQGVGADDAAPASLPILEDRFLPEAMLVRLCGPDGVLTRILRRCDHCFAGGRIASARTGHA